jgi:lipoyl(octanoyl) transferase
VSAGPRSFTSRWLGRVPYGRAHALQEALLAERLRGGVGDTLLLLEHDPVVTFGRAANPANLLLPRAVLESRGVELHETARGGDVTYHGPGQLVAYPIFDLRPDRCDVRRYVRDLARVMIALAAAYGVDASFIDGDSKLVGVWVDQASPFRWPGDPRRDGGAASPAKIGAIGVRISRWVTMHGFAFNVDTDLSAFAMIVPCGITQYGATSLAALGAPARGVAHAAREAHLAFARTFEATGEWLEGDGAYPEGLG